MNGVEQIEARRESPETVLAHVTDETGGLERPRDVIEGAAVVTEVTVLGRPFACGECHGEFYHDGHRGPLPERCKECRRKHVNAGSQSRKLAAKAARAARAAR